jgi:hypothetical protein
MGMSPTVDDLPCAVVHRPASGQPFRLVYRASHRSDVDAVMSVELWTGCRWLTDVCDVPIRELEAAPTVV